MSTAEQPQPFQPYGAHGPLSAHAYREIFSCAPDAMLIVGTDGQFAEVNAAAEQLLGFTRHQLVHASAAQVEEHVRGWTPEATATLLRTGSWLGEVEVRRADGRLVPVAAHGVRVDLPDAPLYIVALRDLTAHREVQDDLRFTLRAARVGTWEWIVATGEVRWSDNLEEIHGLAPGSFGGTFEGYLALVHPEDRPILLDVVSRALAQGGEYDIELRVVLPDQSIQWIAGQGRVISATDGHGGRIVGLARNITAAKRAEAEHTALLEREQQARKQAERAADRTARLQTVAAAFSEALTTGEVAGVVLAHGIDVLHARAGGVAMLSPDGDTLVSIGTANYPAAVVEANHEVPLSAPGPYTEVVRTGQPVWLESREAYAARYPQLGAAFRSGPLGAAVALPLQVEGRTLGSMALRFDRSRSFPPEDRAFMLALAQQCAQALHRARLFAEARDALTIRDEFLVSVSHNLRTPLTAIKGRTQILQRLFARGTPNPSEVTSTLDAIAAATQRMVALVEELVDLSRLQTGRTPALARDAVDLVPLLHHVAAEGEHASGLHRVRVTANRDQIIGQWDHERIERAFFNLITNAVRFSPRGGEVLITATLDDAERVAVVTIQDFGIGIPAVDMPSMQQRFVRGSNVVGRIHGAGMGLSSARTTIERHGGTLALLSTENEGTTVTVTLPLSAEV